MKSPSPPSPTAWSRPACNWCSNPSSRRTSSRARTGSARTGARMTRSPRSIIWPPGSGSITGFWRPASRPASTRSIDEGFDFPGFHIRRMRKRGTSKHYVYAKPSRKAVQAIRDKAKAKTYRSTRHIGLDELITSLNRSLAGWANYFRHGVSKATFSAVDDLTWHRLMRWIRAKYGRHRLGMTALRRRFCDRQCRFAWNGAVLTGASSVAVKRYRYRGSHIPTPWTPAPAPANSSCPAGKTHGAPVRREAHAGYGRGPAGNGPAATPTPRPQAYLTTQGRKGQ